VTVPTLVVRGPDDPIVSQNRAETVAGLLPAGQLVVTATGAHTLIGQLIEVSLSVPGAPPAATQWDRGPQH
jgi:pimeloyl-ACP methyl ester carboxylesterase